MQDGSGLLIPTNGFCVAMRSQGGGQRGWGNTGGEVISRRSGSPELSSGRNLGTCKAETESSGRGAGTGHGAELLQQLAGPGVPWRGRSAAEQGAAEQSGVGVAARVGGGASAWDGEQGVRGRFKGGGPEILGSGSGRKATVVSAGDLGRSVVRALKEEGGPDSVGPCCR